MSDAPQVSLVVANGLVLRAVRLAVAAPSAGLRLRAAEIVPDPEWVGGYRLRVDYAPIGAKDA